MKTYLLLLLPFLLLFGCQEDTKQGLHPFDQAKEIKKNTPKMSINLYELSWLEGLWIDSISFPNNIVVEHWKLSNDTIIGKRGTIKNADTTYSQTSKIFINNDEPVYLLESEGSSFVSFKTKVLTKSSITFGNGANLAPSELTYTKMGNNLGLEFTIITQVGDRKFKHLFKSLK